MFGTDVFNNRIGVYGVLGLDVISDINIEVGGNPDLQFIDTLTCNFIVLSLSGAV